MKKTKEYIKDKAIDILIYIVAIAIITSFIWLPPLIANLTYGDWTCAYEECIVVKGN